MKKYLPKQLTKLATWQLFLFGLIVLIVVLGALEYSGVFSVRTLVGQSSIMGPDNTMRQDNMITLTFDDPSQCICPTCYDEYGCQGHPNFFKSLNIKMDTRLVVIGTIILALLIWAGVTTGFLVVRTDALNKQKNKNLEIQNDLNAQITDLTNQLNDMGIPADERAAFEATIQRLKDDAAQLSTIITGLENELAAQCNQGGKSSSGGKTAGIVIGSLAGVAALGALVTYGMNSGGRSFMRGRVPRVRASPYDDSVDPESTALVPYRDGSVIPYGAGGSIGDGSIGGGSIGGRSIGGPSLRLLGNSPSIQSPYLQPSDPRDVLRTGTGLPFDKRTRSIVPYRT